MGGALLLRGGGGGGPCRDRPCLPRNRQKIPQQTLGFWGKRQVLVSEPLQSLLGQPQQQQHIAAGATRPHEGRRLPAAPGGAAVFLRGGGRHEATAQGEGQLHGAPVPGLLAGGGMSHQDLRLMTGATANVELLSPCICVGSFCLHCFLSFIPPAITILNTLK